MLLEFQLCCIVSYEINLMDWAILLGRGWIYLIFLDLSKEQEQDQVMIKRPAGVGAIFPFPFPYIILIAEN